VVASTLGVLVRAEPVTAARAVGAALVLAGLLVLGYRPPPPPAAGPGG
jgi:drug/metabolite transporter (DMT)-like permease